MLAEPKYRQKYSINPRGLDWTKDDSKIGQKMLEKMGWKKGSGLGLKENGEAEPIKVLTKTDRKGIGCTVKHADNWIAHQDDFTTILAGLNAETSCDQNGSEGSIVATFSLEEKSRSSRSRVHYQKFAKGKDLSRYETADLQSIFGQRKKHVSNNDEPDETQQPAESSGSNSFGVVTVTNTTSIGNYFAQKMAEMKRRLAGSGGANVALITRDQNNDTEVDSGPQSADVSEEASTNLQKRFVEECTAGNEELDEVLSKKKKNKKTRSESLNEDCDSMEKPKKRRKRTLEDFSERSVTLDVSTSSDDLVIVADDAIVNSSQQGSDSEEQSVEISKRESRKNRKKVAELIVDSDLSGNTNNLTDIGVQGVKIFKKETRKNRPKSIEIFDGVDLAQSPHLEQPDSESKIADHALKISKKERRKEKKLAANVPVELTEQPIAIQIDDQSARVSKKSKKESRKNRQSSVEAPIDVDLTLLPIKSGGTLDDDSRIKKLSKKDHRKNRCAAEVHVIDVDLTLDKELCESGKPTSLEMESDVKCHSKSSKKKKNR